MVELTEKEQKRIDKLQKRYVFIHDKEAHASLLLRKDVRLYFGMSVMFLIGSFVRLEWLLKNSKDQTDIGQVLHVTVFILQVVATVLFFLRAMSGEILRSKIEDQLQEGSK